MHKVEEEEEEDNTQSTAAGDSHGSEIASETLEGSPSGLFSDDSKFSPQASPQTELEEQETPSKDFAKTAKSLKILRPTAGPSSSSSSGAQLERSGAFFTQDSLLRFRFCNADESPPVQMKTLVCEKIGTRERTKSSHETSDAATQRKNSDAYRPGGTPKSPQDEMRRQVQSLLNKVCPESIATICEKIANIKVNDCNELEIIIGAVFKKALSEPHYCETYADLVFGLKQALPEFLSATPGAKPVTVKSALLNICQNEFESLPTCMEPTAEELERSDLDEIELRRKKTKDRVLANMKLIGHLFLRQLLSAKVIGCIIQDLTLCNDLEQTPAEHVIECAVELIMAIGHTLESMPVGKAVLQQVCVRLKELKSMKESDGRFVYCKRVQFAIQDLLDVRKDGWTRKMFGGGKAKTKEEIRLEQQREMNAQALGTDCSSGQKVVAGQRPTYMACQTR